MSNLAIKVENLSKKYTISHERERGDDNFREAIIGTTKKIITSLNPFSQTSARKDTTKEEFLALNNISFEVNQGDKVGIIGRNGAGKSTLLKVLSRITEPTSGKIHINGRIASLLEVGTGFHPELTGRENIYLNGAILGMSRAEIKKKFDEIVAFAEVEKFLDTPVKRYSSGMYVRLAFAVAAHLEPEILVVDEVLAVGDVEFQKKCLGKMSEVSKKGRTILFVSHNMNAIEQLCNKAIMLNKGSIVSQNDNVNSIIHQYYSGTNSLLTSNWERTTSQYDNEYFSPLKIQIVDEHGNQTNMPISNDQNLYVQITGKIEVLNKALTIGYCLYTEDSLPLYWSYNTDVAENEWPMLFVGTNVLKSPLPKRLLNEGTYKIELIGGLHFIQWLFEPRKSNPSISIEIQGGISDSPYMMNKRPTALSPIIKWSNINV
ncbi:MAG: ABC transporter ATP-binding protein [Sulfurimonadaceae bacterium]